MSEAIKPTPGPWRIDTFLGCLTGADSKVIGGHADLTLCAEAGTVFHETQCTPRQLVERVKELEDTLCSLAGRFLRCAAAGISAAEAYDSFYRDEVTEVLSKALSPMRLRRRWGSEPHQRLHQALCDLSLVLRAYQSCALCGDWHLGNPSRAKQPID